MLFRALFRPWGRDALLGAGLLVCVAALLLYPTQATQAGREGLALCGNVLLPSLFPFFVLSSLVVELGLADCLGRLLSPLMVPLFRVPGAGAAAVVLGFVGGYPVGARTAVSLYESGLCSRTQTERLLAFCNNAGPAFLFGVVGVGVFSSTRAAVLLYLTHIAASLCVGLCFRFYKPDQPGGASTLPPRIQAPRLAAAFPKCVKQAFQSVLDLSAFVVFFTVAVQLCRLTGLLPALAGLLRRMLALVGADAPWAEPVLVGLVELSGGVLGLGQSGQATLPLAAFLLGWAGVCVHCQVLSFLAGSGLSSRPYLLGKALHGALSALFLHLLCRRFPTLLPEKTVLSAQVEALADLDPSALLTLSTTVAALTWLVFFALALFAIWKNGGKRRKTMIQWGKEC